jgi:lipopolysaccharide export system permease protein
MGRTLLRYVLAEQVLPFWVSLLVLTLVLFLGKIMRYTQLIFASGSGLTECGRLLLYSLPYFLAFTIPMATLLGVLLAFSRLAHDNEITAMRAAGISFYQMMPPVAVLACTAWLLTLALSLFVLPRGNSAFKRELVEMAQSRVQLGLRERVFNDQFRGLVFYIDRISTDGKRLQGVFISDERSPRARNTIVAREAVLVNAPDRGRLDLKLFQGNILRVGERMRSVQTVHFAQYDFHVDLEAVAFRGKSFHRNEKSLSMGELRQALAESESATAEHHELLLEWHRRFSLPFACVVLGFIAAPLGVRSGTGSRFSGVVFGLLLFLLYYIFLSAANALGENGTCSPALGLWLPNVVFGGIAAVLWVKTARESSLDGILGRCELATTAASRLRRGRKRREPP